MSASAIFMALAGLVGTFLPQETLRYAGVAETPAGAAIVQVTGALYLAFAGLNWMARGVLIGGIYSRPVAMGNFIHYAVAAVTLVKAAGFGSPVPVLLGTAVYVAFAVWFGLVVFTHPATK